MLSKYQYQLQLLGYERLNGRNVKESESIQNKIPKYIGKL